MLITIDRAQVEAILAKWAEENIPLGPPIVSEGTAIKWSLDSLSQHQAVLKLAVPDLFGLPAIVPEHAPGFSLVVPSEQAATGSTLSSGGSLTVPTSRTAGTKSAKTVAAPIPPDVPYDQIPDAKPWPGTE